MSGDPERDGSKARPTAPAGVLGGSGKRPESAPVDTGNRAPKSAFAHTIAMPTSAPVPATEPEKLNAPRSTSDAAEPLREPSERPAPTPYKRERAQGQWSGTLQMPEVSTPLGSRSEGRMIAAKPGMRAESGAVEVHGAAKIGTPEPTVRTASAGIPPTAGIAPTSNRPASSRPSGLPAAPPPSGAPPAIPSLNAAAKSPMPPPPKRDDPSVPRLSLGVEKIPSGGPALKPDVGVSQPMQLSLSASDHVETSLRPEAQGPQRSMLPWIIVAVVLVGGGVVFAMTRSGDEPAPVTQDRVEAVPAVAAPTTPATPTETAQAAAPTAPVAPSVPPPAAKPDAPKAPPVEQAKAAPKEDKVEAPAKPSTKRKARRTKKPAKADGPVLKVSPQDEDGELEEALRAAERMAEPEEEDLAPPEPPSAEPPSPD
jgi:hypothetical protein